MGSVWVLVQLRVTDLTDGTNRREADVIFGSRFPRKMRRHSSTNAIGGRPSATQERISTTTATTTTTMIMTTTAATKTRPRVSRHMDLHDGADTRRAVQWRSAVRDEGEGVDAIAAASPPKALRRTWKQMPANRETAFVEAVTSAAITHTLTKNCSSGEFSDCGCDARMTKRRKSLTNVRRSCCTDLILPHYNLNRVRVEVRRLQQQLSVRQRDGATIARGHRRQGGSSRRRGAGCATAQHQGRHGGELKSKASYCDCLAAEWPVGRQLRKCMRELKSAQTIKG